MELTVVIQAAVDRDTELIAQTVEKVEQLDQSVQRLEHRLSSLSRQAGINI